EREPWGDDEEDCNYGDHEGIWQKHPDWISVYDQLLRHIAAHIARSGADPLTHPGIAMFPRAAAQICSAAVCQRPNVICLLGRSIFLKKALFPAHLEASILQRVQDASHSEGLRIEVADTGTLWMHSNPPVHVPEVLAAVKAPLSACGRDEGLVRLDHESTTG